MSTTPTSTKNLPNNSASREREQSTLKTFFNVKKAGTRNGEVAKGGKQKLVHQQPQTILEKGEEVVVATLRRSTRRAVSKESEVKATHKVPVKGLSSFETPTTTSSSKVLSNPTSPQILEPPPSKVVNVTPKKVTKSSSTKVGKSSPTRLDKSSPTKVPKPGSKGSPVVERIVRSASKATLISERPTRPITKGALILERPATTSPTKVTKTVINGRILQFGPSTSDTATSSASRRNLFQKRDLGGPSTSNNILLQDDEEQCGRRDELGCRIGMPVAGSEVSRLSKEVLACENEVLPAQMEKLMKCFTMTDKRLCYGQNYGRNVMCIDEIIKEMTLQKPSTHATVSNFAQMLHLYPTAFEICLTKESNPTGIIKSGGIKRSYVIRALLKNDLEPYWTPSPNEPDTPSKIPYIPMKTISPIKKRYTPVKKLTTTLKNETDPITYQRLEPWRRTCRIKIFKYKLIKFLREKHFEFLESKGLLYSEEKKKKVKRFHPSFKPDQVIIPEFEIQKMPDHSEGVMKTVEDYRNSVLDVTSALPERTLKLIEKLASPEKKAGGGKVIVDEKAKDEASAPPIKLTVKERMMLRDKEKKERELFRNPEMEARKDKLTSLEKNVLKHICSFYTMKKCVSMSMKTVTDKLCYGLGNVKSSQIQEWIDVLCEVAPNHVSKAKVGSNQFLKVASESYTAIMQLLKAEIQKCI
uniref:CDT1 domain-containing protein n=1 Tax=Rhabditophanes sp. KR3021 TaxID=114890 RepID=A0AC35U2S4_9BILA